MVIPYDFTRARYQVPNMTGYWVKLFCVFDGQNIFHFAHSYDMIENSLLAHECGVNVTTFIHEILVDKNHHPEIFNEIESYVQSSHSNPQSELQ